MTVITFRRSTSNGSDSIILKRYKVADPLELANENPKWDGESVLLYKGSPMYIFDTIDNFSHMHVKYAVSIVSNKASPTIYRNDDIGELIPYIAAIKDLSGKGKEIDYVKSLDEKLNRNKSSIDGGFIGHAIVGKWMFMEFFEKSLDRLLNSRVSITSESRANIVRKIFRLIDRMHDLDMCYTDIKLSQVLTRSYPSRYNKLRSAMSVNEGKVEVKLGDLDHSLCSGNVRPRTFKFPKETFGMKTDAKVNPEAHTLWAFGLFILETYGVNINCIAREVPTIFDINVKLSSLRNIVVPDDIYEMCKYCLLDKDKKWMNTILN